MLLPQEIRYRFILNDVYTRHGKEAEAGKKQFSHVTIKPSNILEYASLPIPCSVWFFSVFLLKTKSRTIYI